MVMIIQTVFFTTDKKIAREQQMHIIEHPTADSTKSLYRYAYHLCCEPFFQVISFDKVLQCTSIFKISCAPVHVCNWHIKKNYEERASDKVECKLFLTVKPFFKTISGRIEKNVQILMQN